jgi:tRNA(fMet)-specific endonuclease VapC
MTLGELKTLLKKLPGLEAELWSDLSRKGVQIGTHDLIIGSTALSLGFSVATYNPRHFERIEGLKIETLTLQQ